MKRNSLWIPAIALTALGLITYGFSFRNDFIGDDFVQIVDNPVIDSVSNIPTLFSGGTFYFEGEKNLKGGYYRPLPMVIYTLISATLGKNPLYFHLMQTAIHIANAMLIYLLIRKFSDYRPALLTALLFTVHPINVETIVYIANLQDVMYVFFGLIGTLLLISRRFKSSRQLLFSSLAFLLSLFAKETGILFLMAGFIYLKLFRPQSQQSYIKRAALILLIYFMFRVGAVGFATAQTTAYPIAKASLPVRLLTLPAVNWYYFKTFFFPDRLYSMQQWLVTSITDSRFYISSIFLLAMGLGLRLFGHQLKKNKTATYKTFLWFSLWAAFGMLMHSQILPLDATVSDRWFYFTIIGFMGILGLILQNLPVRVWLAIIALLPLLIVRSIDRTKDWQNELTLYTSDINSENQSFVLLNGLGVVYYKQGNLSAAEHYLLESIRLTPDWLFSWTNLGRVYETQYDQTGNIEFFDKAMASYRNTLPLTGSTESYEAISALYVKINNLAEARTILETGLKKHPNNGKLLLNLSIAEYKAGNLSQAMNLAQKAVAFLPYEKTEAWYQYLLSLSKTP